GAAPGAATTGARARGPVPSPADRGGTPPRVDERHVLRGLPRLALPLLPEARPPPALGRRRRPRDGRTLLRQRRPRRAPGVRPGRRAPLDGRAGDRPRSAHRARCGRAGTVRLATAPGGPSSARTVRTPPRALRSRAG